MTELHDMHPGQEFLMEVHAFVDVDGCEGGPGVCLAIDGECGGRDGYCGGCGGCMIMQAHHAGYHCRVEWERMLVSHRLAWDDALGDVERWCDEQERLAGETLRLVDPDAVANLPRYWGNDEARRAGLHLGQSYRGHWGELRVVW